MDKLRLRLMFATRNGHKAEEVAAMVDARVSIETLLDRPELPEPDEPEPTFEGNALAKARAIHRLTGMPTLADDSGLEVDALGGAPGVRSKRFSEEGTAEANNRLLLQRLDGVAQRSARFRCVLALVTGEREVVAEGRCEGRIAVAPAGQGGFGYDPLFLPDEAPGRTLAELTMEEKNAISHRGRAVAQLGAMLKEAGLEHG